MTDESERDEDGYEKMLLEGDMDITTLKFGCKHSVEAVDFGLLRLKLLLEADADEKRIEAEVSITDPLVKMYIFVGMQRSAHRIFYGLKEMWRLHRSNIRSLTLLGGVLPDGMDDDAWAYEAAYKPVSEAFERVFIDLLPRYYERLQNLHDDEHNLVPWEYPELDVPQKPSMVGPVTLSDDERQRVEKLLLWGEDD